ncbi:adhesion G-protein coupled receptor F1-like [Polyodon spathula]|uniref:adhesion G-protein coupled receptor F1-like n=1 Tax=Polyodon spathula TaxID=7913 RepID=UPI001B7E76C4|nr:adhesion G-protein coupled receptor F1-like [Polyodon spathula]
MAMHAVNLYSIILLLLVNISQAEVLHGYKDQYNLKVGCTSVNREYQINSPLRQKREVTNLQEYVIHIEMFVSIPDESFLDGLKQFLKNIPYPLDVGQNVSVTDGVLTTICTQNGEQTQCKCENDYAWSYTICNKYKSCSGEYVNTCDCIEVASPYGLYCQAKSSFVLKMTFSMDNEFVPALNNKSSLEYNQYKSDIEDALMQGYSGTVKSVQTVAVTGFRSGSVIVDYEVATTGTLSSSDFQAGNNKITSALLEKGYQVNPASFTGFEGFCNNSAYGVGQDLATIVTACSAQEIGNITVQCKNGTWNIISKKCVLKAISDILSDAQKLESSSKPVITELPILIEQLKNTSTLFKNNITLSAATISSVVDILTIFSNAAKNIIISETELKGFIETVNNIIGSESILSWDALNKQNADSSSSHLLKSVELFATSFSTNSSFNLETNNINLKAIKITNKNSAYNESFKFNNTVGGSVSIPPSELSTLPVIVSIAYLSLSDILPVRNHTTNEKVNGIVLTTIVNSIVKNVSLDFEMKNTSLGKPECVFWNFDLFNNTGSWDTFGCRSVASGKNNIRCQCEHLTSFSILMSPEDIPHKDETLSYITYIGLGISIGSLFLCLLIEAIVWQSVNKNKTSYIRHVSIVNLALSLLIADIWFIIGTKIDVSTPACSAATFFTHFFYLALFFWMLTLAILLFFRVVLVFKDLGKSQMLAIAFCLGYGCPLIIAVVSVAVTAPGGNYTRTGACWLNWDNTMVLLAFVIPALVIITINFIILIVVIVKMVRRTIGDMSRAEETSTLKVVARCIAILTPFLGLTWGFGIGTLLAPCSMGILVVFAVLNSFQGFFVLVFGTLLDSKIRDALLKKFSLSRYSSQQTNTTSGISSDRYNIFGKKKIHRLHEVSSSSDSTLNIGLYSKLTENN